eukprot:1185990-Prorocentrum_minimum.AAC.3
MPIELRAHCCRTHLRQLVQLGHESEPWRELHAQGFLPVLRHLVEPPLLLHLRRALRELQQRGQHVGRQQGRPRVSELEHVDMAPLVLKRSAPLAEREAVVIVAEVHLLQKPQADAGVQRAVVDLPLGQGPGVPPGRLDRLVLNQPIRS